MNTLIEFDSEITIIKEITTIIPFWVLNFRLGNLIETSFSSQTNVLVKKLNIRN